MQGADADVKCHLLALDVRRGCRYAIQRSRTVVGMDYAFNVSVCSLPALLEGVFGLFLSSWPVCSDQ